MSESVLVTGATGQQGGAIARTLLDHGHRVRALTRRPDSDPARQLESLGAELAHGDFEDAESLRRAFKGIDATFVMGTPFETDPDTEVRHSIAVLDAAAEAGVDHVVYSSVASALDDTGIPHFESKAVVERHLGTLDLRHTVIAPAAFFENLIAPWTLPGLSEGSYVFGLPADRGLQQVAVADIAGFAVLALEQPERLTGQRVELASIEATGAEVAATLTRATGREVRYEELPLEAARAGMGEDFARMIEFFRGPGYAVDIPALHAAYPEIGWHSLEGWAATIDWGRLLAS